MAKTKINFNIDDELLLAVDDFAKKMCINRTSALAFLLSRALLEDTNKKGGESN